MSSYGAKDTRTTNHSLKAGSRCISFVTSVWLNLKSRE